MRLDLTPASHGSFHTESALRIALIAPNSRLCSDVEQEECALPLHSPWQRVCSLRVSCAKGHESRKQEKANRRSLRLLAPEQGSSDLPCLLRGTALALWLLFSSSKEHSYLFSKHTGL